MIDEKDFFREATLRICGSLEIEKALWDCLMYIRQYIPADFMRMSTYDPNTGIGEDIAEADINGGKILYRKLAALKDEHEAIMKIINSAHTAPVIVVADRVSEQPIFRSFSQFGVKPEASAMAIGPKPEWNMNGGIAVVSYSGEKYTEEHQRLFALLNEPFAIAFINCIRYREVMRLKDILADDNRYLQDELREQKGEDIVGANFGLRQVMEMVRQVAPLASSVLLLGETGTGKEVIANAIHNLSPRRNGPFIKVNCGAIPESLMDSELFGHEKGAFTGALFQKRGRFERADGGTIFLDEIGELTPGTQLRLLRVLQEHEIERVGGADPIALDIRVIAATHRNLDAMLTEGKFREDIYFRLKVFPITIPPLRERSADIPALASYFIMKKSRDMGLVEIPVPAQGAIDKLMQYNWPGNVRELQNVVERAIILSQGKPLTFDEIGAAVSKPSAISHQIEASSFGFEEAMVNHIRRALAATGGRVGGDKGAANLLNMNPSTLRTKMRKLGIPFGKKSQGSGNKIQGAKL